MQKLANRKLKRILFITVGFPVEGKLKPGGIGQFTYNLAKKLAQTGTRVYVLGCSKELKSQIKIIHRETNLQAVIYPFIPFPAGAEYLNRILFSIRIMKNILIERIQIVEAPSYLGWLWPFKPRIPLVVRLHSSSTIDDIKQLKNLHKLPARLKFEMATTAKADKIISVCRYTKTELLNYFPAFNIKNIDVIYNGIDVERFSPSGQIKRPCQVLFVGNLSVQKGALDLMKAWNIVIKQMKTARMMFIGAAPVSEVHDYYLQHKKQWQDSVEIHEPVPNEQLVSYYREATIVVVPSHFEANPLVLLEAMSCGCAVVAPDHTGFTEILRNNHNGILCDTKAPDTLAGEILRLLTDTELSRRIGQNARESILEKFNATKILEENLALYDSMLKT